MKLLFMIKGLAIMLPYHYGQCVGGEEREDFFIIIPPFFYFCSWLRGQETVSEGKI